jgi:1,4-dihydroxy-2-naphthoate octaprenyltransferase
MPLTTELAALISSWMRVIRVRFLLASVIAVSTGLAVAYWKTGQISPFDALLTYVGVIFLHASVDLLNDYWDSKRGIDSATTRTNFSGGTGVLPEKLLTSKAVYSAGIMFLILGGAVGTYFVLTKGITVAIILGFAVIAIYFYSTSIVNAGLGELFVGTKGAMIVIGTFFVQAQVIDIAAVLMGVVVGLLSATVLYVNAFPDYAADKSAGRRTLVILLGKGNATRLFPFFFASAYGLAIGAAVFGYTSVYSLASLASIPLALRAILQLRRDSQNLAHLVPAMSSTVTYSRVTGALLALGFLLK